MSLWERAQVQEVLRRQVMSTVALILPFHKTADL